MSLEQPSFASPHHLRGFDAGLGVGEVSHSTGDAERDLLVTFFVRPVYMEYLSKSMGHPIFQDRIFTRIVAPGNTKTVWEHETKGVKYDTATDPDSGEYHTTWEKLEVCENGDQIEPDKYPKAWAKFMKKGAQLEDGWPIEEWGAISRSMAESLKMLNVPTVEALASLSDARAGEIMGGRKFRDLAKASLDERRKNEIVSREQERAARAEERAAMQETQIKELTQIIQQMQAQFAQLAGQQAAPIGQAAPAQPAGLKQVSVKTSKRAQAALAQAAQESGEAA